jgi:Zn-dependent peptidase ImmA (M78 family)
MLLEKDRAMNEVRSIARNILEENGLLNSKPIDIKGLAHKFKIRVEDTDLPSDVSGVLDTRNEAEPIILLNSQQAESRKRFSMAHELGHFFLHHRMGKVHMDKNVFFRNDIPNKEDQRMEREANVFAAELLMPRQLIQDSFQQKQTEEIYSPWDEDILPSRLADEFCVSLSAMVIRLQELKLIPKGF